MDLTVDKSALHDALKPVVAAAGTKQNSSVIFDALMGGLECRAASNTVAVRRACKAHVDEAGAVAVAAKDVLQVVKNLPTGRVSITHDGANLVIKSGSSRFRLHVLEATDLFPEDPEDDAFISVTASVVAGLVARGGSAHSTDSTRLHLNGVHIESDGETLLAVSTDGHRMHYASAEHPWRPGEVGPIPPLARTILCDVLAEAQGDCLIATVKGLWFFRYGDTVVSARPLSKPGSFPQWRNVVPEKTGKAISAPREHLIEVVKRVSFMADRGNRPVVLALGPNILVVSASRDEFGEAEEAVQIDYDGKGLRIAFNSIYFLNALEQVTTDTVRLEFNGELDSCVVRPFDQTTGEVGDEFLAVVMPVRL